MQRAPKPRPGYVDRGMVFPAYPTDEQVAKIEAMQPSLRAAWNWLVSRIEEPLKAHEAMLVRKGLIDPPVPRPDYSGLQPEEVKARKLEYVEACKNRRKQIFDSGIPVEWRPNLQGPGSEAERLGFTQGYQVVNSYLSGKNLPAVPSLVMLKLLDNFKSVATGHKRKRQKRECVTMPIQVNSGPKIRLRRHTDHNWHRNRCNAEVYLPSVGWISVYLCPDFINQLMTPGNTVREGCTLKYEHGRWYASVKVIRRERMHPGPGDGSV